MYKPHASQNLDLPVLRDQGSGLREVSPRDQVVGLREVSLRDHMGGLHEFLLRNQGVYLGSLTPRHGVTQQKKRSGSASLRC